MAREQAQGPRPGAGLEIQTGRVASALELRYTHALTPVEGRRELDGSGADAGVNVKNRVLTLLASFLL